MDPAPQVAIQDESGNTLTNATHAVTVALGANAAGATLTGTTTAYAVGGVATFAGLRIDRPGNGYTLVATAAELSGATSAAFRIALTITAVSAGINHTCAITAVHATYCWGNNVEGQLGDGTLTRSTIPVLVAVPAGVTFVAVRPGGGHTCALTPAGAAYCWGAGGLLGDGTTEASRTPVPVAGPDGTRFTMLTASGARTCGITTTGEAYCWGGNSYLGELGDGTTESRPAPTRVAVPPAVRFQHLSAGYSHTCGVTTVEEVYCWGWNSGPTPVRVAMPEGVTLVAVAAGMADTCGMTAGGAAYCWGDNMHGQIGDGTTTPRPTPTLVAAPSGVTFAEVRAAWEHNCALTTEGMVYCWGRGALLGDGTSEHRFTPVPVAAPPGIRFATVSAGGNHTCALTPEGSAYCWGQNDVGKLGNGELFGFSLVPVPVVQ
jgi:alpha-tubulin suppressor-like RCC1 family protein